jgi:hypothetical protein
MKKLILFYSTLNLGLLIVFSGGCKKSAGPQGPAGPAGSSNVVSNTYVASSWPYTSPYYYNNLSVSALTATNVNTSAVMVYLNKGDGKWIALPYTQYNSPSNYYMGFNTSAGNVQVTWTYDSSFSSGSDPNTFYGATVQLKVVVIPPALVKKNINLRNFEEVKSAYNL